jgi:hypothetical protein
MGCTCIVFLVTEAMLFLVILWPQQVTFTKENQIKSATAGRGKYGNVR